MVNKLLSPLLNAVFPHYCSLCGALSDTPYPLCRACRDDLQCNSSCCDRCALPLPARAGTAVRVCGACLQQPPPFDRVRAPWVYCERMSHLIRQWKYRQNWYLTPTLAALWLQQAETPELDLLVPVPLHWRRQWQRGCNQSELLCRQLQRASKALDQLELARSLLRRNRATPAQSAMDAAQRSRNLQGAFTVRHPCDNLRIALVDDVLTTGATATAVASALREAGAAEIEVWCLARTPAPGS